MKRYDSVLEMVEDLGSKRILRKIKKTLKKREKWMISKSAAKEIAEVIEFWRKNHLIKREYTLELLTLLASVKGNKSLKASLPMILAYFEELVGEDAAVPEVEQ